MVSDRIVKVEEHGDGSFKRRLTREEIDEQRQEMAYRKYLNAQYEEFKERRKNSADIPHRRPHMTRDLSGGIRVSDLRVPEDGDEAVFIGVVVDTSRDNTILDSGQEVVELLDLPEDFSLNLGTVLQARGDVVEPGVLSVKEAIQCDGVVDEEGWQ
jgi:hypothetical protein